MEAQTNYQEFILYFILKSQSEANVRPDDVQILFLVQMEYTVFNQTGFFYYKLNFKVISHKREGEICIMTHPSLSFRKLCTLIGERTQYISALQLFPRK